jgi:hypothetical protein
VSLHKAASRGAVRKQQSSEKGKHAQHIEETTGDRRLHLFRIRVSRTVVEDMVGDMMYFDVFDVCR